MAHYQELLRVPFIWSDPVRTARGAMTQAIAGTIDISATFLDRVATHPFNGLQGRSFLRAERDRAAAHRSEILAGDKNQRSVAGLGERPRERTLVTDRFRLSLFLGRTWASLAI